MELLIDPIGDFPLNDDWAYGTAVRNFLEQGQLVLPDWTAANLIFQIGWGAIFCLPFGFSYTALRISVLILGLIAILVTFATARELGARPLHAFFAALTLASNPLFLISSNTFMTDVPYVALATLSTFYFIRALMHGKFRNIAGGALFCTLSILVRQTGLALSAAFSVSWLARNRAHTRAIAAATFVIGLAMITQVSVAHWIAATGTPSRYGHQAKEVFDTLVLPPSRIVRLFGKHLVVSLVYLGLFTAPLLVLRARPAVSRDHRAWALAAVLGVILLSGGMWLQQQVMPAWHNIIIDIGLGPLTLLGGGGLAKPEYLTLVWLAITATGILFGALLISVAAREAVKCARGLMLHERRAATTTFLFVYLAAYAIPILAVQDPYDRYLLPLLPPLILLLVISRKMLSNGRLAHGLCLSALLVQTSASVCAVHDYLAWNRARWNLAFQLLAANVPPSHIHGGFEFGGLYFFKSAEDVFRYFDHHLPPYLLAFAPISGYEITGRQTTGAWLPFSPKAVLLLRSLDH